MITPVLTLDESRISSYDPQDPVDLSLLWSGTLIIVARPIAIATHPLTTPTAFSRTSHVVEQGERLRNFSWRLWNRERLCTTRNRNSIAAHNTCSSSSLQQMPELSSSVDSSSSTETEDDSTDSSTASGHTVGDGQTRPKDRHITPVDLRNLVHSIKQPRELKRQNRPRSLEREAESSRPALPRPTIPQPSSPRHVATESSTSTVATAITDSFASMGAKSDTSVSSNGSSQHSIVRGFTPGTGVTSYASKYPVTSAPQPQPILKNQPPNVSGLPLKKSNGIFMLGGSSGSAASAEDGDSLRNIVASQSLHSSGALERPSVASKKQALFKDEVAVMKPKAHEDAAVFDDSDEEDSSDGEVSESAIDDDDDDDAWEDEGSDSIEPEPKKDEMKFCRVDSRAHLPSRRSALTLNLEDQRAGGQQNRGVRSTPAFKRSRTSTPNGPSMPGSPEEDFHLEMHSQETQPSKPIIPTTTNTQPQTLAPLTSPRTTRRNMIAGELSESLRKNILSERQQRNPLQIDSNQMRHAHTAFDVSRLSRLPEHSESNKGDDGKDAPNQRGKQYSWNHYFDHSVGEFHQAGW